jgi:Flp pilus assembly protein TadG
MNKIRTLLENRNFERADVVQTVFMFPIAIFLLFAMINLSSFFQLRAEVQNVARDGARLTALYGGQSPNAIRNTTGKSVTDQLMTQLWDGKQCTLSYCTAKPVIKCSPEVARDAGEIVKCTITYAYSPIAPVPDGLEGLNGVVGQPIAVSATYVSETGKKG